MTATDAERLAAIDHVIAGLRHLPECQTPGCMDTRHRLDQLGPVAFTATAEARVHLELVSRYVVLLTHGLLGATAGMLILVAGVGPALAVLGPEVRLLLGSLATVAGWVLYAATVRRQEGSRMQVLGALGMTTFYAALFVSYVASIASAPTPVLTGPWEPSTNPVPPYPLAIFAGLVFLGARQTLTLAQLRRAARGR